MKIKNKHNKKTAAITTTVIVTLALIGGVTVAYLLGSDSQNNPDTSSDARTSESSDDTVNLNSPTQEQLEAAGQQKQESLDQTDNGTKSSSFNVIITASNQTSTLLQVRTLIDSVVGGGSCSLELTKEQATVARVASTQASASTSTCQGFECPSANCPPVSGPCASLCQPDLQ